VLAGLLPAFYNTKHHQKKIMADDDDDNNNATTTSGGDIEKGRSSSSWVAPADGHRLTVSTSTTLGRLEHVDEEEVAPVPLLQQIADMDMAEMIIKNKKEGNKIAKSIKTNVAPSEDESTTLQGAMEQIEDGDDAAPRPFGYASEFYEDDPKPMLDLGEESTDDDDGPPLPLTFGQQRDSLSDAKNMVATSQTTSAASPIDNNESIRRNPTVGQIDRRQSPGDEENILQRVIRPENSPASDDEIARPVAASLSAAAEAERYPSLPILEGYLVEEEVEGPLTAVVEIPPPDVPAVNPGGYDTVYEATPIEPDLPWWKQRRTKVFMVINCVLIAVVALSVGLGVAFSRPTAVDNTATTNTTTAPNAETGDSSSSSASLTTKPSYKCFADRNELKAAVDLYVKDGCGAVTTLCKDLSVTYGWPMGSWCVDDVADMSSLFQGLDTFNEDISLWNISRVTSMSYMFKGATSFNQNLCAWQDNFPYSSASDIFVDSGCAYKDTPSNEYQGPFCASSCNTESLTDCFTSRDELKAAIDEYVQGYWDTAESTKFGWPIGSWCVRKVTDMSELFKDLSAFNEDISGWDVGQVTTMQGMFSGASSFNGNISSWDTSAVTDMSRMFREASSFNRDLSSWNTSSVTTMSFMLKGASSFNQNLCAWKDNFPYSSAYDIFWGSGCTIKNTPLIDQRGPFCSSDCTIS
jgi:surface protein